MTDSGAGQRWASIEALFDEVRDLDAEGQRRHLEAATDDASLREEVLSLLEADREPLSFLDDDALSFVEPELDAEESTDSPSTVGSYRLLEELGRGGSSQVFRARRLDDRLGDQQVAIKRLSAVGWHREDLERRFRAEGRVLGTLSHPNIANVLDAGVDEHGVPFLVMELVVGQTITDVCHREQPTTRQRLELFLDVCAAVSHAHQRLIVHRDLKPSNILVDERGVVKLLDFGIAKLLHGDSGERVELTRTGLLPLTPQYAAPEQIRGESITTATDVFALGLLLYELLAGVTPYDLSEVRGPTQLEELVTRGPAQRPSEVQSRRDLRGDLDTITMKALEADPGARYPSVEALADDVRRHLDGLPILAVPVGPLKRSLKFCRRHVWGVAFASAALLAGVAFLVALTLEQRETARQRDRAQHESRTANQVTELVLGLFEASDPRQSLGEDVTARQLLEGGFGAIDSVDDPSVRARMLEVLGLVYGRLGNLDRGEQLLREALAEDAGRDLEPIVRARMEDRLGAILLEKSEHDEAEALFRSSGEVREAVLGGDHADVAASLSNRATVHLQRTEYDAAAPLLERALEIRLAAGDEGSQGLGETMVNLGEVLQEIGDVERGVELMRGAVEVFRGSVGERHPRFADALNQLAAVLGKTGSYRESVALMDQALVIRRDLFGEDHHLVAKAVNDLAVTRERLGALAAAAEGYAKALEIYERLLGGDHLAVAIIANNLSKVESLRGRGAEALALAERSGRIARDSSGGAMSAYVVNALSAQAVANEVLGELETSDRLHRDALAGVESLYEPSSSRVATVQLAYAEMLVRGGHIQRGLELSENAHATLLEKYGAIHLATARASWVRAKALMREGRQNEAGQLALEAWRAQDAVQAGRHPHAVETLELLEELGVEPE